MRNLLGLFVVAVAYLVAVYHLVNLYFAKQGAFERFLLVDGHPYPLLFWGGYVVVGSLVPLALIFHPRFGGARSMLAASLLVVAGAFALLYVFVVGGQAWPLDLFPGYVVRSTFGDGRIAAYAPSAYEVVLGTGGLGVAFLITVVGVRALQFLPQDDIRAAS